MNSRVIITAEDRTSEGINSVKTSMAGLGATIGVFAAGAQVAIGAIAEMSQQTIGLWKEQVALADSMDEMSIRMGMSIKDLSYWKTAAEMNGATIDSMAAGTRMLAKHMVEHGTAMRRAGIDTTDANKAFLQLSDLFAGMTDPVARLDLATKLFGRGIGQQLLPTLVMGSKGLLEIKEATDGYGAALERLSPEAQKLNDGMSLMRVNFKQAYTESVYPLVKALNDEMLPAMRDVSKEGSILKTMFVGFGGVMKLTFTNPFTETLLGAKATLQQFQADVSLMLAKGTFGKVSENHLKEAQRMQAAVRATLAEAANYRPVPGVQQASGPMLPGANSNAEAADLARSLKGGGTTGRAAKADPFDTLLKGIGERTAALTAEAESTDRLSESQKFALKLMTDLQGGYLKLTDAQKVTLGARLESMLAADQENQKTEALRKTMLEQAKAAEQASAAQRKVLEALQEKASAAEFELATYGMTKSEIEATTIARLEERRAMYAGMDGYEKELAALEAEIAARMRLRDAMSGIEAKAATKKAIDDQEKEWKRFTDEVDRALTDALMRGFESGKGGGKAFVDSIKNTLKTAAFKIAVSAVVNPIMGAAASALGMSGGGSGGGLGTTSNMLSIGNSASNLMGGAYAAYNTGAYMALGNMGMEQAAMLAAQDAVFGAAGTAATLEAAGASAFASTIGAALPYVGIALAAGSMLGLFDGGGDDPHNNPQASGYHMTLSKAGVSGAAGLGSPSSFLAGPTSGAGWWGDNMALSAEQVAALNQQTAAAFAQGQLLALQLGMDPSSADKAMVISTLHGNASNGAIAGYFSSIDQAFAALADAIAYQIVPNLNEFQASGESLAQTAARLSQEFALTNRMATLMGKDAATAFGGNNLKARDALIQQLGGLGGATSVFDSYYRNFHSETERAADTRGSIAATLRAIGISDVPATRDQFRALVEGQDLASEAGRSMYATLLSVAEAFTGITESAEEAAKALAESMGTDRFKTRADYLFARKTGIIPAYADGGDHDGGWAMVGERGRELAYMPPAHVYSNRDSKALLDLSPVTQAIDDLRADMRAANAAIARASNKTAKILDQWDGDGLPIERVIP